MSARRPTRLPRWHEWSIYVGFGLLLATGLAWLALDRWVRLLAPSISTGKSIRDSIITTRHQAPAVLAEPVAALVARMDQGWSTHDALLAMADEVAKAVAYLASLEAGWVNGQVLPVNGGSLVC